MEGEIELSIDEITSITKNVDGRLQFLTVKDPEVQSGNFKSYSTIIASKIKEKFGASVKVGDGKKNTKEKTIIFMKCNHGKSVNVSMNRRDLVQDRSLKLNVKQKMACVQCQPGKKTEFLFI